MCSKQSMQYGKILYKKLPNLNDRHLWRSEEEELRSAYCPSPREVSTSALSVIICEIISS